MKKWNLSVLVRRNADALKALLQLCMDLYGFTQEFEHYSLKSAAYLNSQ